LFTRRNCKKQNPQDDVGKTANPFQLSANYFSNRSNQKKIYINLAIFKKMLYNFEKILMLKK